MKWEMVLLIGGGVGLVGGCLTPNRYLPPLPNDKFMHFAAFGGLTALALRLTQGPAEAAAALFGLLLAGWLIECLQQLVPDRGFSWPDMLANTVGIVTAALATACCAAL